MKNSRSLVLDVWKFSHFKIRKNASPKSPIADLSNKKKIKSRINISCVIVACPWQSQPHLVCLIIITGKVLLTRDLFDWNVWMFKIRNVFNFHRAIERVARSKADISMNRICTSMMRAEMNSRKCSETHSSYIETMKRAIIAQNCTKLFVGLPLQASVILL